MTNYTYNTGNAIGSTDVRDGVDNLISLDTMMNSQDNTYQDRLGNTVPTAKGAIVRLGMAVQTWTSKTGGTLTDPAQTFLNNTSGSAGLGNYYAWAGAFPKVVAAGTDPAAVAGFVMRSDVTLRGELGSVGSDIQVSGVSAKDLAQTNLERKSVVAYGAKPSPFDSTAAFIAAYADKGYAYIPEGVFFTSVYYPDKSYGEGRVLSSNSLFPDSGERGVLPFPLKPTNWCIRAKTFGNLERAAGFGLIVNADERPEISGYSSDSQMATYVNRDHVGMYIGMYGPQNPVNTTPASTSYTATSITAPEIVEANKAKIAIGMFVKTRHSPPFSGRVTGVDFSINKLTVSGWYQEGNTSAGQVPANGTKAIINACDKIWGQNTNLYLLRNSEVATATGYELGIISDGTPSTPVWGFHAVNLNGAVYSFDKAFYATGKWNDGCSFTADVGNGMRHVDPGSAAVLTQIINASNWSGSVIKLTTNYPDTGRLLQILDGSSQELWSIKCNGHRSTQRESATVVSSSVSVSPQTASIILCTNSAPIVLTPSGTFRAGHIFEIKSAAGQSISFSGRTVEAGKYAKFVHDGSSWQMLFMV